MDMHLIYLSDISSSSIKPVLEGGVVTDPAPNRLITKLRRMPLLTTIWLPAIAFHIPLDGSLAEAEEVQAEEGVPLSDLNLDPLHHIPTTSTVVR